MRFAVILVSFACSAGLLSAQQAVKKGSISGMVVSSAGAALRKADVYLNRMDQGVGSNSLAITDADGRFVFPSVTPGQYVLSAQKTGYIHSSITEGRTRRTGIMKVGDGEALTGISLTLYPQGVITGKVMDEDGDPLQGVNLQVATFGYARGKRQLMTRGSAQSNDIGEYRIANLLPGKYVVFANRQGSFLNVSASEVVEEGYPIVFYPNALDPAQATQLESTPGNELRSIDFRMRKVRTFHIRGQITDYAAAEKAGPHFAVYVTRTSGGFGLGGPGGGSPVHPDGSFDIPGLVPGSYIVAAMRMVQGYSTVATVPVELGNRNQEGVSLTLGDGINLKGTLKFEGAPQDATKLRISLEPIETSVFSVPNSQPAKADGTFTILGASPSKYRVTANGMPANCYIKSVKAGQQEVFDTGLDLSAGSPGDLEITISDKAASVAGTVRNDKQQPAPGALVLLLASGARQGQSRFLRNAIVQQDGSFKLAGITPGEYLLFAFDVLEEGSWDDPEFLPRYESKATKLKLSEGSSESTQLTTLTAERTTP